MKSIKFYEISDEDTIWGSYSHLSRQIKTTRFENKENAFKAAKILLEHFTPKTTKSWYNGGFEHRYVLVGCEMEDDHSVRRIYETNSRRYVMEPEVLIVNGKEFESKDLIISYIGEWEQGKKREHVVYIYERNIILGDDMLDDLISL